MGLYQISGYHWRNPFVGTHCSNCSISSCWPKVVGNSTKSPNNKGVPRTKRLDAPSSEGKFSHICSLSVRTVIPGSLAFKELKPWRWKVSHLCEWYDVNEGNLADAFFPNRMARVYNRMSSTQSIQLKKKHGTAWHRLTATRNVTTDL